MSTGDEVTQILDQLRGLLGEGTPVTAPLPSQVPAQIQQRLNALPGGLGAFIDKLIDERKSQAEISAALAEVETAIAAWLAVRAEAGRPAPEPRYRPAIYAARDAA